MLYLKKVRKQVSSGYNFNNRINLKISRTVTQVDLLFDFKENFSKLLIRTYKVKIAVLTLAINLRISKVFVNTQSLTVQTT